MKYRRFQKIVRNVILAVLVFVLFTEPILVAAKAPEKDAHAEAVKTLVTGGDAYLDSASKAVAQSMALLGYLNTIQSTPVNQISETYISDAIDRALKIAGQSSIALGSVGVISDGIEQLGGTLPAAMDVSEATAAGFSQEMRNELSTLGVSSTDIDQVSASASELYSARQTGIPANVQADLLRYGFTQPQIDQISLAVSQRGLVNSGLATKLDQFRATQDELADTRTGMVILAVQLLGYQIAARQANGIAPRAITDDELKALSEDELRLLVHVAHLNAMWGSDPNSEIGEGDWWFIEQYAGRAAERLQAVTVESQNRSLVAELFVLHQMKMLAVSARTGDAKYARTEMNGLAALLSHQLNVTAYYQEHQNLGWMEQTWARITALPAFRENVEWSIPEPVAKNARLVMRERVDAAGVENLALIIGGFDESNEANNIGGVLIVAGLSFSQLDAGTVQATLSLGDSFVNGSALLWLDAIMTGDTDNPALLIANVIIGFIPVFNIISDVWTLLKTPDILLKALAIFALICDIGSTASFLVVQAELVGIAWVGRAAEVVTKGLAKANTLLLAAYKGMKLEKAVNTLVELFRIVILKIGSNVIGHSLFEVIGKLGNLLTGALKIWDNFCAFAIRAEWELIVKLGINDSTLLVGRVIRSGASLSDEALVALKYVGDDLVEAGVTLSDDAAKGLGNAAKILEEGEIRQFTNKLLKTCVAGNIKPATYKLARPALACDPDLLEKVLASIGKFDDETLTAAAKIKQLGGSDNFGTLIAKYASNPDDLTAVKSVFGGLGKALANPNYTEAGRYLYRMQLLDLAKSTDNAQALQLGRYFDEISSLHLAQVSVNQGFEVSKLSKICNCDIRVAGRWSDTPSEAARRLEAWNEAQALIAKYRKNKSLLPQNVQEELLNFEDEADAIIVFWAKSEAGQQYGLDWYQVKKSGQGAVTDLDIFIPISRWNGLSDTLKADIKTKLQAKFNVTTVDFYQLLPLDTTKWRPWMPLLGSPNPSVNIPPSAILFGASGIVQHPPFP